MVIPFLMQLSDKPTAKSFESLIVRWATHSLAGCKEPFQNANVEYS